VIAEFAKRQWGVVSREQLVAAGASPGAIKVRLRAERLHVLHRGVYAVGHTRLRLEARLMAAVLACGVGAVVSHRSAAYLLEMRRTNRDRIDVTTPRRTGRRPPRGVELHTTRALPPEDVTVHKGIPTTTARRTLTDLAEVLTQRELERAADRAEKRHLHAPITTRHGRKGTPSLDALKHHPAGTTDTTNDFEELLMSICDEFGLPRPIANHPINGYVADFAWPEHNLIAETDGYETHGTREAFEHDRQRDRDLLINRWRTTRITYRQASMNRLRVGEELEALLTPTQPRARPRAAARPR
jgi:very-short-patch-repair endonuclease